MILNPRDELDLQEIKEAIREDYSNDDIGIMRAARSAIAYIKGAIGNDKPSFYLQDNETIDLLNLGILLLTDHYYHAGSATIESSSQNGVLREYDLGFNSLLLQLKAEYKVFKEEETNEEK
ncbi:head-tail connector protein [Enterococcus faecium]|uniref:head-tail connector protein n=1 Tax=Enterococcus faecium TaxID=1352 RepID=UPI0019125C7E|nr:head-tail connector protein [Enterococcus faecium]MBK5028040.1 phage head-tail connector protein [Enterococcus faecium]MBK5039525.1 phage head-tail connector protein [Enterococcus faecium]MBK5044452.1 phage head-tail connector protein [Enterococcus faecium]MBK5069415.1 phage head-tail connector protein [Enterococcus faecium]MBK5132151.1 phage head-tail connector protein [Enterococcus faecium]